MEPRWASASFAFFTKASAGSPVKTGTVLIGRDIFKSQYTFSRPRRQRALGFVLPGVVLRIGIDRGGLGTLARNPLTYV